MHLDIKDDAIFIADAHYNTNRVEFDHFLDQILQNQIKTSQIFFMGDMFDYLSGQIDYFKTVNKLIIDKINHISKTISIIYFEGNHDYNLSLIFPNIQVISRIQQPLIANYQNKKVALAHGDIFTPLGYNIYSAIIRSVFVLKILNQFTFLPSKVEQFLIDKNICTSFKNFERFASNRIKLYQSYGVDFIVEGHFHQGKKYKNYINIPSFACDKNYFDTKTVFSDI